MKKKEHKRGGSAFASTLFVCLVSVAAGQAQVTNDAIKNRYILKVDETLMHSSTYQSSVEWNCVNKSLTKKCLVYHNDQWFQFSIPEAGRYFLNLANQQCRAKRGLQVLVIEGNPCDTDTYRIHTCIDRIPQEDVFVVLDSLRGNTQYLVNIDGFLEDNCDFDIQLATRPRGFPHVLNVDEEVSTDLISRDSVVQISIDLTDQQSGQFTHFEIHRRRSGDERSILVTAFQVEKNSVGKPIQQYIRSDTLITQGRYTYRIVGQDETGMRTILKCHDILYADDRVISSTTEASDWIITVPLRKDRSAKVSTYLYDGPSNQLLQHKDWDVRRNRPDSIQLSVSDYVKADKRIFVVRMVYDKSQQVQREVFILNEERKILERQE